ncbi:MAG TPA: MSMEG_4193 family putative phosphomutase [Marmoricola sp.]|nr:MSMEG_4193 family putative phosphomutase [Marmoricola sp.]
MAILILARHGRTAANASGILAGRTAGIGLDEQGIAQARSAELRLEGLELSRVVSSPMQRCLQTAGLLAPDHEVAVEPGLDECDYGDWTGGQVKDLAAEDLWRTVQVHPTRARFPNGESVSEMATRAVLSVRRIDSEVTEAQGEDSIWLAVSHGDIIKALLNEALGAHLDAFQRILVNPASLSVIRYTSERPYVLAMNTTSGGLADLLRPTSDHARVRGATVGGGQ